MFDQHSSDARTVTDRPFENSEWRLLGDGLEHRATGYVIARETIAMRRGDLWEWPLHLAEKTWCTPRSFRQAFLAAVEAFGAVADASLDRSFAAAFGLGSDAGSRSGGATVGAEDFVALGDLLRSKPASPAPARKRGNGSEPRVTLRRGGIPMSQQTGEKARQRAAL